MTFSIIGNGNMAWFLGQRLTAAGHSCAAVYSRSAGKAEELAKAVNAPKYVTLSGIANNEADVCFLTVSDTAISEVAAKLSFTDTVLIHTAGAVPLVAISNASPHCAVFWPVYSILKHQFPTHRDIPCAYEASSEKAGEYITLTGNAITDTLFEAGYEQRKWLHLAAVVGNNFINHLMTICEQICAENNLPVSILLPIIAQTFERIKTTAPKDSQTGPAIRHDESTLSAHLAILASHPRWQAIYAAITRSIQASNSGN